MPTEAPLDAPFDLQTPALLVDRPKFDANLERMRAHVAKVTASSPSPPRFRPHLKTVKSVELARRITDALGTDAITVSTLLEAERFADAGYTDILYAVGIVPTKLDRVAALRSKGVDLTVITDNASTAQAIAAYCRAHAVRIPVMIEIDCDGHRSGMAPEANLELVALANMIGNGAELRGVMTHAGGSYDARSPEELHAHATRERVGTLLAANTLRDAKHKAPVVSIGSTPTALNTDNLDGITELRAGVFSFFDLVMQGIGVCKVEDIALSVLTTVIGHQKDKGWIIVDAGWMAMSRDRGTANHAVDQGYGLACTAAGAPLDDLIMVSANQEHGILALRETSGREGSDAPLPDLPVGTQLRILPNHACATAAQFDAYAMVDNPGGVIERIPRFSGW